MKEEINLDSLESKLSLLMSEIENLNSELFRLQSLTGQNETIPEHNFTVEVKKLTDIDLAKEFIEYSVNGEFKSKLTDLRKLYASEHSPMYSQIYIIKFKNIFHFVAHHIRTHKKNFICETITSNREDRGGVKNQNRYTPVNMLIICNAKSIIDMMQKRICKQAKIETINVMLEVRNELSFQNDPLSEFLVPKCVYRNGLCGEFKCCGFIDTEKYRYIQSIYNQNFKVANHDR